MNLIYILIRSFAYIIRGGGGGRSLTRPPSLFTSRDHDVTSGGKQGRLLLKYNDSRFMRPSDQGIIASLTYYSLLWRPEKLHSMVIDFIVEGLLPDCLITLEESHFQVATPWLT